MENVEGLWKLRIAGVEWPLADAPSYSPSHTSNEKVLDSAGRVVGNKQTITPPTLSATVICKGGSFKKLVTLATSGGDLTAEAISESTGAAYVVYGARQNGQLTLADHSCQVNFQGDTSA